MAFKLHVNIRTLLSNCEELAKNEDSFWRLQKYIKSLDTMIAELEDIHESPNSHLIKGYTERIAALKLATNYTNNNSTNHNSSNSAEECKNALKEIRQIQNSKHYNELRQDLLQDGDALRRRRGPDESVATNSQINDNMNEAVKYHNNTQEKITEHMLSLTRNLKEQTETANRIIRNDTEVVAKSTGMAERNINSLGKEAEKLEQHSRGAYKCWLWLMIVFVIIVFIFMVLFMKVMKKKK